MKDALPGRGGHLGYTVWWESWKKKCDPALSLCGAQKPLHKGLWEEDGVAGSCLLLPLPEALSPPWADFFLYEIAYKRLNSSYLFLFVFLLCSSLKHILILPVPQPHFSWWWWKVFKVTDIIPWATMKEIREKKKKKKEEETQKEIPGLSDAQQCLYFNYRERGTRLNRVWDRERKNYVRKPDTESIKEQLAVNG